LLDRPRLGVDAGARAAAAARGRSRLRALRPRRLARPARGDPRDRRRRDLGDARRGRSPRTLPARAGARCQGTAYAIRRRGRRRRRKREPGGGGAVRMKRFAELFAALDATNKTNAKVDAVRAYLAEAPPADAAWAVYFLRGGKLRAPFSSRLLLQWAVEAAGLPAWLVDESYDAVGDLGETAALLLPHPPPADTGAAQRADSLAAWIELRLVPLRELTVEAQKASVLASWGRLTPQQRFVWNKLVTGGFRAGVSEGLVTKALAAVTGL